MSTINTNGIDATYPVPGVNNSTQGFRDNFSGIKVNLDTAYTEITDLQNKVIVKNALSGFPVDNNMANTLISNALVRSFRATTYNLGNNISGSTTIDASKGDVQYGTIVANTTINFGGWGPAGTQSNVQLQLSVSNANAVISLPVTTQNTTSKPISGMKHSVRVVENYFSNVASPGANSVYTNQISAPAGVQELNFTISTLDCGVTLDIDPVNRPQRVTQVSGNRSVTGIGQVGDRAGTLVTNGTDLYFCIANYDGSTPIWRKVALTGI